MAGRSLHLVENVGSSLNSDLGSVRLTTCASAAGPQARPRTIFRSTAPSRRVVAERSLAPTPARRLHARVRRLPARSPSQRRSACHVPCICTNVPWQKTGLVSS
jgi:hypothetical protein